jgi:quercetin dioxygenase-like cupin family protein
VAALSDPILAQGNPAMNPIAPIRLRLISVVTLLAVALASAVWAVGTVTATPPSGLTAEPLAAGDLKQPVRLKLKDDHGGFGPGINVTRITTVKYTLEPGGTFGWHQHGGPVWAVIASGTLSLYRGDDPTCTADVYPAGTSFLDPGDHTHIARNNGDVPMVVYATFMMPEGGLLRIDVDDPGNCPF